MNYMANCYMCGKFKKIKATMLLTVKEDDLMKVFEEKEICEECLNELNKLKEGK